MSTPNTRGEKRRRTGPRQVPRNAHAAAATRRANMPNANTNTNPNSNISSPPRTQAPIPRINDDSNNADSQTPLRCNNERTTNTPRQLVPVHRNTTSAVGQPGYRFAYTWTPPTAQVFTSRVPLLRHVPLRSRPAVARALTHVLWDCSMAENPERSHNACLHLFMFPACILHATPPRKYRVTITGERISIHETIKSDLAM